MIIFNIIVTYSTGILFFLNQDHFDPEQRKYRTVVFSRNLHI